MVKIKIISVGRKTDLNIAKIISEYEKRISVYCHVDWFFVEPSKGKMSIELQKQRESEGILNKISDEFVILLDENGNNINNAEMAVLLEKITINNKNIVFVIGGAFGVSDNLKNRSNFIISLSKLVFPHELVRLILIEQIYRSYSIIKQLPYHHQ